MQTARYFLGCLILIGLLGSVGSSTGRAGTSAPSASPEPPPSPEAIALAGQIVAAPDDIARDQLLAARPRAPAENIALRRAIIVAGYAAYHKGDFAAVEIDARYARRLAEVERDRAGVYGADQLRAYVLVARGDDEAVMRLLGPCRQFFESVGDKDQLALTLVMEGTVDFHRGEYRRALPLLRQAQGLFVELDKKSGVLSTLNITANIFGDQGQAERANQYQQQALALAGDDPFWQTALFHNIASVYASQGEFANAIVYMEKSVALAEKRGDQPSLGADVESLAEYHQEAGRIEQAQSEFERALKIAEEAGDKSQQSSCLNGLAAVALARGGSLLQAGLDQAKRALALGHETGTPTDIRHAGTTLGKLCRTLGRPDEARAAFAEAIAVIEDTRGHLTGGDQDATAFLADKLEAYQEYAALLAEANRPVEALAMAERAKARVLVEVLSSPRLDLAKAMTPAESATAQQRADEIASLNRQMTAARSASPSLPAAELARLDDELAAARRARDDAESDFFAAHPELRNRRPPPAGDGGVSNTMLQGLLADGRTALLEYVVAQNETWLFVVTKGSSPEAPPVVRSQRLPLGRATLTARARAFRTALAERSLNWQADARSLGDDLLSPAWAACADAPRLVIVPDGPLWELPFQALVVDEGGTPAAASRTLLETRSVSFAPSLTFLARTPAPDVAGRPARLLAVGNPALANPPPVRNNIKSPAAADSVLMNDETVPLPDAERQVRALGTLYGVGRSRTLIGKEAHEDLFKRLAGDYEVLHFATHGFLNDTAPMYSRLLMAQTDLAPDEDGFLEAWEWLPLKLHARLAVLSACETGRGKVGAGEGVLGLSWALFSAGCPAAVVSQWKVDSVSTTALMIAFHRRLLAGDPPGEALRAAGLELAKNPKYRHPFYWAPFVVIGSDQPVAAKRP